MLDLHEPCSVLLLERNFLLSNEPAQQYDALLLTVSFHLQRSQYIFIPNRRVCSRSIRLIPGIVAMRLRILSSVASLQE